VGNDKKHDEEIAYGVIAQDIMNDFPELVTTFEQKAHPNDNGPQKYYWVNSDKLQWVTINAFKELNNRVIILEKQVKDLMDKIK
jgi:polyhydroxyalkanoate synthesis regulator phasin